MSKTGEMSSGKHPSYRHILILKEEHDRLFDIEVSPTTYFQAIEGGVMYFNLREFDIKQTSKNNILYFFGPIISFGISLGGLLFGYLERKDY